MIPTVGIKTFPIINKNISKSNVSNMSNLTKQGVRNLDALFGRVKSQPREQPPISFMCKHKNKRTAGVLFCDTVICNDCGCEWENGKLVDMGIIDEVAQ